MVKVALPAAVEMVVAEPNVIPVLESPTEIAPEALKVP
jgi:hypothetical protein